MSITKDRLNFKPFEYQWAYDYWFKQQNAHWLHTEINMQSDIHDWNENLSFQEKNVIGDILKGFTQTETEVGNYWSEMIPKWFPIPEIKMMGQTFGSFETIHAVAYSYLNDILGLDDFHAFLKDEATMNKLKILMDIRKSPHGQYDQKEIARSIALFSAAAEGIQLFSSFAVLLSFRKSNRLKGIGQQIIFSVRDESLHSEAGCKIFRTFCDENEGLKKSVEKSVYQGIDLALRNEFIFIDQIFGKGDLSTIKKEDLKNFMKDRANLKLRELGLNDSYHINKDLLSNMDWFYITISGEQQTDFFDNRETGYSKPNEDWNDDLFISSNLEDVYNKKKSENKILKILLENKKENLGGSECISCES
ncbi:ribonucleotide-diphosphate reductase subunit beta [Blattabacterium cuenoti]|uniref:ribonucleoside-diphosphate reductase n=2 Tax=Blattabacterium cuenoti TaxID=1653831 RepID=M4ZRW6_9FLAO|nr:ribonucleotide-diphosphate reductase subunit beta [Blattabacterium cuenoti]BAM99432.1 ribonucleoside-diphosphate reductase subunit [Blattabacterium cuenoti BPAA]BAR91889.1 ribonucleoside-diphosphate reductase subunitbeta [Blattabacterium cuenoti BPAY]